jgi:hypothetical protein
MTVHVATSPTIRPERAPRRLDLRLLGTLVLAAAVGAAAIVPYQLATMAHAIEEAGLTPAAFAVATIGSGTLLAAIAALLGLWLGPRVGLGAPLLAALVRGRVDRSAWASALALAVPAGALVAGAVVAIDLALAPWLPDVAGGAPVPLALRYLASLYGTVNEELLLRLGLLTAVAWLLARATRSSAPLGRPLLWVATVVAAVGFGAAHLSAVAAAVPLDALVVARTIGLNASLGLVFGWLYWSRGLAAAMAAHLAADLVIQTAAWAMA